jgi:signal transduction histidine kinase
MDNQQSLQERVLNLEQKLIIMTQLAEMSTSLNSRVQLEPLLKYIMDVAVQITNCEAASVLLWNNRKQQLFFAASTTAAKDDSLIGMPVPMDSIAGSILRENKVVQIDDARTDPRHYNKVDEEIEFETRSLLGVPMTYKDRVIGVLEAINKRNLPWTQDDHHVLSILAAQAAVAIEGAQLVTELKRANDELAELDKLKNDFIAIASHELRTPLGVIMGYASFLQEAQDADTQTHASKVLESALKLRKIIEDMVNLRYLKQKQGDLHREIIPVSQFFTSIEREVHMLIDTDNHNLQIVMPEEGDNPDINIDSTRLMMVVTNLLNNALAFTPHDGDISITHTTYPHEVWVHVKDSGKGLEPHQLERIFEEFTQVEDHMTRHHQGLGIGLSIARAIVKAHGGRIWAESEGAGKGATFTFTLPRMI